MYQSERLVLVLVLVLILDRIRLDTVWKEIRVPFHAVAEDDDDVDRMDPSYLKKSQRTWMVVVHWVYWMSNDDLDSYYDL